MAGSLDLNISVDTSAVARLAHLNVPGAASAALDDAANQIVGIMQSNMHFDRGYSTGATQESVDVQQDGELARSIGPQTDYAQYPEWGTYKMAAEPFAHPSMDAARQALQQAVREKLAAALGGP